MRYHLLSFVLTLTLALSLGACGGGEDYESDGDDDDTSGSGDLCASPCVIAVSGFEFTPASVTIAEGSEVTFELSGTHTALEVSESTWDAGGTEALSGGFSVGAGQTATVTLSGLGSHWYVCEPHAGMGMKGTIEVVAAE